MKKVFLVLYYSFASKLPSSFFPLGKIFNYLRIFFLKRLMDIGDNNKVQPNVYIGQGKKIFIGSNNQINEYVRLIDVKIGNYVMLGPYVNLIGGKSHNYERTDIPMMLQGEKYIGHITIEDDVWLGLGVVVMPGVTIGKGSIVGANAVVTKDIPPYSVFGGVPAKIIKKRKNDLV